MSDYKAYVAKIEKTIPIEKADKIHIAVVMGEFTIVSKEWVTGMTGLFFPAETQLSEEFCKHNNLYRDSSMNADPKKAGFFEPNRRVRCQKFLGVASEGFFCKLDSVAFCKYKYDQLKVGQSFSELNGVEIARKYVKQPKRQKGLSNKVKNNRSARKWLVPEFKEHTDTSHFNYNLHKIEKGDLISIQAKGHGTSGRSGLHQVEKPLPKWKKVANRFGAKFQPEKVFEEVVGTRRVVLEDPTVDGFHGSQEFRFKVHKEIASFLKPGMTVYYEIVGYANEKPIMPKHNMTKFKDKRYTKKYGKTIDYTYGCATGECMYYIYRVADTTLSGEQRDLTQMQLVRWCKERELPCCLDVIEPFVYNGCEDELREIVGELTERPEVLTEDFRFPGTISEGVVVRVDQGKLAPLFLKSKSFPFKVCEGIAREQELDMEDAGGVLEDE